MEKAAKNVNHIAIAGNIGAGKTTLCETLSKQFSWEPHYESADNNPYLQDFYHDMQRWSFNLQIFFLNSRYKQILQIQQGESTVIQDRTIYEDAHIFAPNLHEMGLLSKRDFDNYLDLFQTMKSQIRPPDLLIYLKADIPTLVKHIHERGRNYEGNISLEYLKRLNDKYNKWIENYNEGRLLVVPVDNKDLKGNEEHLGELINNIQAELHGLF
ncbi:MAG TPA: deoxynucleoside kinase [Saprospiraceae bacterium]|nr:deoxynucleoside kinase [Saprospiraceae bacterium]